jgi:trans-2,3-dihydro-3-hydroxyanthranilate isomerase
MFETVRISKMDIISVRQSYEIERPSILYLQGSLDEKGEFLLKVGGKVQWVASGEWMV